MHGVLAFVAGICTTIGVLLIAFALAGITYYGITTEAELAAAIIALVVAAIAVLILYFALRAQSYKVETGKEALIGSTGVATTDLNPNGTVRVNGEFWQATAKDSMVKKDENVKVIGMKGMFLVVQATEEKA
jgi:membrane-bound serine protease (ClpP class)